MPRAAAIPSIAVALATTAAIALAGCGSSSSAPAGGGTASTSPGTGSAAAANAADAAFVRHMLVHHRRALEVGRLAQEHGTDPRVRAFGARIVREQTPEAARLSSWVRTLRVRTSPSDAEMATGYVTDAALRRLGTTPSRTFDRAVLLDSARSETGAAAMAAVELRSGTYGPARALARSIATAPHGEIPQLRALAAALPR